jgi:hypothetical protein
VSADEIAAKYPIVLDLEERILDPEVGELFSSLEGSSWTPRC